MGNYSARQCRWLYRVKGLVGMLQGASTSNGEDLGGKVGSSSQGRWQGVGHLVKSPLQRQKVAFAHRGWDSNRGF